MKTISKILIKIAFVAVAPVLTTASLIYYLANYGFDSMAFIAIVVIAVLSYLNAALYIVFMGKVKVLPNLDFSAAPVLGLGIAWERDRTCMIIMPFCTLELNWKKR